MMLEKVGFNHLKWLLYTVNITGYYILVDLLWMIPSGKLT